LLAQVTGAGTAGKNSAWHSVGQQQQQQFNNNNSNENKDRGGVGEPTLTAMACSLMGPAVVDSWSRLAACARGACRWMATMHAYGAGSRRLLEQACHMCAWCMQVDGDNACCPWQAP